MRQQAVRGGWIGKTGEVVLCWFEGGEVRTLAELTEKLGWSRKRDVRLRIVDPLVGYGLLVDHGDEIYSTPDREEYETRQDDVRHMAYSTIQLRGARSYDSSPGKYVHHIVESGQFASEAKREAAEREDYRLQRKAFRERLTKLRREAHLRGMAVELAEDEHVTAEGEVVREEHPEGCQCVGCYAVELQE